MMNTASTAYRAAIPGHTGCGALERGPGEDGRSFITPSSWPRVFAVSAASSRSFSSSSVSRPWTKCSRSSAATEFRSASQTRRSLCITMGLPMFAGGNTYTPHDMPRYVISWEADRLRPPAAAPAGVPAAPPEHAAEQRERGDQENDPQRPAAPEAEGKSAPQDEETPDREQDGNDGQDAAAQPARAAHPGALPRPSRRARRAARPGRARCRLPSLRQIPGHRGEIEAGLGCECLVKALVQLVERQPAGGVVLAQLRGDSLSFGVPHAHVPAGAELVVSRCHDALRTQSGPTYVEARYIANSPAASRPCGCRGGSQPRGSPIWVPGCGTSGCQPRT